MYFSVNQVGLFQLYFGLLLRKDQSGKEVRRANLFWATQSAALAATVKPAIFENQEKTRTAFVDGLAEKVLVTL